MKPSEKVNIFLSQLEERLKELERTDHIIKSAYNVGQHPQAPIKIKDFEDDEDVLDFCKNLDGRIQEVENYRNPSMLHNKVQFQFQLIEGLTETQAKIKQMFKHFEIDDRFVQLYSDDEIKDFYVNSCLTATDVKKYLDKIEKRDVSMTDVSKYVNGNLDDLKTRSLLGNYFKYEALKKTSKDKKAY